MFPGGTHPHEGVNGKAVNSGNAIRELPAPARVVIPLSQHIGAPCKPIVQKGDLVLAGQKIGEAGGFVSAPVHSSVSGKVVGIVVGVLVVAYLGLGAWASASHKIYPNVMMGDTNYGGMTEQQVAEQLKASVAQAKGTEVDFVLPDGTEVAHVLLDEMPEYVDFDGLAKHIYNVYGCNDSFLTAGAKYLRALFKPQDAAQVVDAAYSPDLMENLVDTVCDSINCDPVEFAINVTEDGKVSVTKPQDGRATTDTVYLNGAYLSGGDPSEIVLEPASEGGVYDVIPAQEVDLSAQREAVIGQKVNATYDKETGAVTPGHAGVEFTLSDLESAYNAAAAGETVELPNATVETPDVTAEQLQKVLFRDVLSTYTTKVGGASGRRANVKLTASRITGYILNSGETMKYGPLVTPFTAANGYSAAPGYLQGKTVDMVGGGACQASSTLYAAALYANLEIVQRVNHGYASDYIGLGRRAGPSSSSATTRCTPSRSSPNITRAAARTSSRSRCAARRSTTAT